MDNLRKRTKKIGALRSKRGEFLRLMEFLCGFVGKAKAKANSESELLSRVAVSSTPYSRRPAARWLRWFQWVPIAVFHALFRVGVEYVQSRWCSAEHELASTPLKMQFH